MQSAAKTTDWKSLGILKKGFYMHTWLKGQTLDPSDEMKSLQSWVMVWNHCLFHDEWFHTVWCCSSYTIILFIVCTSILSSLLNIFRLIRLNVWSVDTDGQRDFCINSNSNKGRPVLMLMLLPACRLGQAGSGCRTSGSLSEISRSRTFEASCDSPLSLV